ELVLDRLERADRARESVTRLGVLGRHLKTDLASADLLERDQHRRAIEHLLGQIPALTSGAEALGLRALEFKLGVTACRIERLQRRARNAGLTEINEHQRNAAAFLGDDNRVRGAITVSHRYLHAGER